MKIESTIEKPRYFYVSYTAFSENGKQTSGCCDVITGKGEFLSLKQVNEHIKKDGGFVSVIVNNFIELNEKDFKDLIN
ncbi:hypothetical protein [Chryseobacterium vrystaatense]|uniref:Uncharacterized protein n=1 Tax=Chryseobacterium vrystaatense TaxID=307480 RepID=A0A1M4ZKP4_9FLAO|nr:hypothetical protein [Chryseobacterium vrystaatense]SHF18146.1 hypothetical protein SAMN02787073_1616 [Chryseobacterium vrystaatense]